MLRTIASAWGRGIVMKLEEGESRQGGEVWVQVVDR